MFNKDGDKIGEEKNLTNWDIAKFGDLSDLNNFDMISIKNDKFILSWHQRGSTRDFDYDSYYIIFNKNYEIIKIQTRIGINITKDQMHPNLLRMKNENILFTFQSNFNEDNYGFAIKSLIYDENELIIKNEILINSSILGNQFFPKSTNLENGDIIILYLFDGDPSFNYHIISVYSQKIDFNLNKIKLEILLENNISKYTPII